MGVRVPPSAPSWKQRGFRLLPESPYRLKKPQVEKLSRRVPRRLKEFSYLRRSFLDRKAHRFCGIHRVVFVNTALSSHGFQPALQSVYRLGFP